MAVRVDHQGQLCTDFHTAGVDGFLRADDKLENDNVIVSRRAYICDASFLVGLEGDRASLEEIDAALAHPRWQLYLGRKACVPSVPVRVPNGLSDAPLLDALEAEPWVQRPADKKRPERLHVVEEISLVEAARIVPDQPEGAAYRDRRFGPRGVGITTIDLPA
jgi:CRISPR system Cascade subunit CasD